jgi:hypothetical protein
LDELFPLFLLDVLFDEEGLLVLFTDLEPVLWFDPSKLLERPFFADPAFWLLDSPLEWLLPLPLLELLFAEEVILVLFTDLEPVLWFDPSKPSFSFLERPFFADPAFLLLDSPLERLLPLSLLEMLFDEEVLLAQFTDLEPVLWFDPSKPSFSFVERASFDDPAFWLLDSPLERLFG